VNSVEGHIFLEYGLPANDIDVNLYSRGFGGRDILLGKGKTDGQGYYKVSYQSDTKSPRNLRHPLNLEVRTVDANGKEISLSETKFNAAKDEVLNLVAPKSVRLLTDEYSRLVGDLKKQLKSINKLADAQEKDEHHDLSVLHHATGWDARLISILAKATKLSEETGIPQDILYALLRVGLPSERGLLANVDILVVEKALNKAKEAGIISKSDDDNLSIRKAKKAFERFAHSILREAKAPGTVSTTAELLDKSVLSGQNNNEKRTFENLYLTHRGSPEELWIKAQEKGISEEKIQGLRLQGKLAYLTLNNAPLAKKLQKEIASPAKLSRLVELDLYDEKSWKDRLNSMAGGGREQALAKVIPPGYEGNRVTDRLDAYSADLARKVRLSFPTKVVARMIKKGELEFIKDGGNNKHDKEDLVTFLNKAEKLGFQLGRVPIDAFVQNNKEHLFPRDTPEGKVKATKENIKKLQRLYQITPSNESLNILLKQGFSSASDIVAFSKEDFLSSFGHLFPSLEEAELVYRKSEQVSTVTNSVLTTARLMASTPAVYAISPSAEIRQKSRNELIKHYPSMESLLGSPDFCECEHCQSVLSPAAYFVDLLKFLEPDDNVWKGFLDDWQNKHNKEKYMTDWNKDDKEKKPYHALIERRPDLPHLPLTCENTNTALPYIDLVNEIFEYYVAWSNLNQYRGDTSGDTTTPELLAEPQNILPAAYNKLRLAPYPLTLPFDLWLETVRLFFNHFDIPLWKILDVFHLGQEPLFNIASRELIQNSTNETNATVTLRYDPAPDMFDASDFFKAGNAVTYRDVSTGRLHNETKIISSISVLPDTGSVVMTLSGKWETPPDRDDWLILLDRRYSWANIFSEYLEISPAEYGFFSRSQEQWWMLYGYTTESEAINDSTDQETGQRIDLNSAKTLSRRLGVTYKELVDLIRTGFVNPGLNSMIILRKLGLDVKEIFQYKKDLRYKDQWFTAEEENAFKKRLEDFGEKFNFDAMTWLETACANKEFDKILVLAEQDQDSRGCNFDKTILRNADTTRADKMVFLKINLFVRLWKKLGWTIEETDQVIQAFIRAFLPRNFPELTAHTLALVLKLVLVYIAHLKDIDERVNVGKNSLIKLLALWSDISTRGRNPLYDQLFLTHGAAQSIDPVFDDPLGQYLLPTSGVFVKDQLPSLQAALNLTADEIKQILKDAQKNFDSEPFERLTLATVSLLYRYGLLAKGLKISIHELISLKQLSGLDPFKAIEPNPPSSINQDHLLKQTLEFIKIVEKIKESGFKVEDLNYLLRHQFDDPLGKYRSKPEAALALIQRLAAEISRIQAENELLITDAVLQEKLATHLPSRLTQDFIKLVKELANNNNSSTMTDAELRQRIFALFPSVSLEDHLQLIKKLIADLRSEYTSLTDDIIRQKLSLVLSSDVVDRFFGFWKDTIEFSAKKEQVEPTRKLDPSKYEVNGIRVSYDPNRKWQHVVHAGVLTNEKKASIINKIPIPDPDASPEESAAYNNFIGILDKIASESQPQPKAFFDRHFEGFLNYDDLYGSPSSASEEAKRHKLLESILPFIQQRLTRQLVVQTLATNLNAEPKLTEMLISDACFLADPLIQGRPLFNAFEAAGDNAVSVKFFDNYENQVRNQIGLTRNVDTADTAAKLDNVAVKPPGAKSARFDGYFAVPTTGAYHFFLVLSKRNIEARFRLYHLPDSLINGKATKDGEEIQGSTELEEGILYRFSIDIDKIDIDSLGSNGDVTLLVQGVNIPKGSLSQLTLYPYTAIEQSIRAYVLLAKVLQLIQGLGLSQREIRYILHAKCEPPGSLAHESDFSDIDLSKLPTIENDDSTAADSIQLFKQFILLIDYARLKHDLSSGTDDLIGIFENASKSYPEITNPDEAKLVHLKPLAHLTRRDVETVLAVAERMGLGIKASTLDKGCHVEIQGIVSVEKLWRLWKALQVVEKLGVPIEKILVWATSHPDFSIAQDIRNTVKSRYERENWLAIAPSIFDKLRQRKRDALVAYMMHNGGFERIEQLFEFFLIDPGMEPVVQTSRLRLAISSVQLFIQRCLLNLEKKVHPSAIIDSHQWQWMKRYRVWEANKKIFLFPENWLEPEFRDDKSYLFQELEGALMQGDVSNDLVEGAFYNYLKKLEELANLDIVTMYCEEKENSAATAAVANTVLHVIGRTHSLPHKYFYRRYVNQIWTPWEPVTAEIQGDHIVAVVWRERLHIFWVTFLERSKSAVHETANKDMTFGDMADKKISESVSKQVEIQLNWCEYYQGQWTTRESNDVRNSIVLDYVNEQFTSNRVFIHVTEDEEDGQTVLRINLDVPLTFFDKQPDLETFKTAFKMLSKNIPPIIEKQDNLVKPTYNFDNQGPNKFTEDGDQLIFVSRSGGSVGDEHFPILSHPWHHSHSLLFSSNISDLFLSHGGVSNYNPFFYQDRFSTFFVQPTLYETQVQAWEEWIISPIQSKASLDIDDIDDIPIEINIPQIGPLRETMPSSPPNYPIDSLARYKIKEKKDWVTYPAIVLLFDHRLIASDGGLDIKVVHSRDNSSPSEPNRSVANVKPYSELTSDDVVVASDDDYYLYGAAVVGSASNDPHKSHAGQAWPPDIRVKVIDSRGMNSAVLRSLKIEKRTRGQRY
jgi:hypothetical protein